MLEEIVHTILPTTRTLRCKKKPFANRANNRKRRNKNTNENTDETLGELNLSMDNAETHALKIPRFKVPMLMSFLIFYVCIINVIISCDVSISDINNKERNGGLYERETIRELPKYWHGHKRDSYGKNLRKGRASAKRQTDDAKQEKYGPEAQEFIKYYDYYKDKDDVPNATEFPSFFQMGNYIHDDSRAVGHPHDLASHPYFVKNIQFNLRPERHLFKEKIIKLGVLLPADANQIFSLGKVLPIIEMAIPAVTDPDGPLPGWTILVDYRDTRCSSVEGPLAAFEFYVHEAAGKHFFIFF